MFEHPIKRVLEGNVFKYTSTVHALSVELTVDGDTMKGHRRAVRRRRGWTVLPEAEDVTLLPEPPTITGRHLADAPRAGAVLYAKNMEGVAAFYAGVVGLMVRRAERDYIALEAPAVELVVVEIPRPIADSVEIADPPARRAETPIKLVFVVESLADARRASVRLGGALNPASDARRFDGHRVCDGCDPEGNVFQFRERAR